MEAVRSSVVEDPNKSYRKRAQTLLMKPSSMLTILKKDLKLTPYKMHNVQQLTQADKTTRMEMCLRFQEKMDNDDKWINNVWFSDEAHFYLNETLIHRTAGLGVVNLPMKSMNVHFTVLNVQHGALSVQTG